MQQAHVKLNLAIPIVWHIKLFINGFGNGENIRNPIIVSQSFKNISTTRNKIKMFSKILVSKLKNLISKSTVKTPKIHNQIKIKCFHIIGIFLSIPINFKRFTLANDFRNFALNSVSGEALTKYCGSIDLFTKNFWQSYKLSSWKKCFTLWPSASIVWSLDDFFLIHASGVALLAWTLDIAFLGSGVGEEVTMGLFPCCLSMKLFWGLREAIDDDWVINKLEMMMMIDDYVMNWRDIVF